MNLLQETIKKLDENGKSLSDVQFVMAGDSHGLYEIPLDAFLILSNIDYDNDYGSAEINTSLTVVGAGWWLERAEYDGSEWWEYKETIKKPKAVYIPKSLKI